MQALRFRVARRKAETLADDPRFGHLLAARIANAARKPRDPNRSAGSPLQYKLSSYLVVSDHENSALSRRKCVNGPLAYLHPTYLVTAGARAPSCAPSTPYGTRTGGGRRRTRTASPWCES
ncbi:unnamed protein product [Ixodes persulcatus]